MAAAANLARPNRATFRTEHIAEAPRGWRTRLIVPGPWSSHRVGIAFPPGRRKKGSGKLIEILHPKDEATNPACSISKANPSELLIFGNPSKRHKRRMPNAGHKKNCPCFACKHQRATANGRRLGVRVGIHNPRRRRMDRNPTDTEQAVRLFESFHGRDAESIIEKQVSAAMRKDYAALGDLEKLIVRTPLGEKVTFDFEGDGVMLAGSPPDKAGKCRQLYCIGGRQNLLPLLDADSQRTDFIDLGECLQVEYFARKWDTNYEGMTRYHKLGEVTGSRPHLMFDKLRKLIFFVGGDYFINADVDRSPGIEN